MTFQPYFRVNSRPIPGPFQAHSRSIPGPFQAHSKSIPGTFQAQSINKIANCMSICYYLILSIISLYCLFPYWTEQFFYSVSFTFYFAKLVYLVATYLLLINKETTQSIYCVHTQLFSPSVCYTATEVSYVELLFIFIKY